MKLQEILEIKATILEVAKDSPLLAYVAFYEPLHNWLNELADGWNPIAKLLLNIVMVVYGIMRIIAIFKSWDDKNKDDKNDDEGLG